MNFRLTRFITIAVLGFVAACGEAPTGPSASPGLVPASPNLSVSLSSVSLSSVSLSNAGFEGGYTGWTFAGNPGDFVDIGPLWDATEGLNSVDLNGVYAGSVSQNISTIPGVVYTVMFDLAGNPGSPQGVKPVRVSAAGTSTTYSFNTTGKSGTNMGWRPETFSFTATSATTTLKFESLYVGSGYPDRAQGPALDNVRVTFVPPPAPTTTTVTFGSGPFVYAGTAFTATASVSPAAAGTATISYSGDCTNAGNTCQATATFPGSDGYAASTASASITIDKAPTTTTVSFGAGPFVYTGSAFTATASVSPAGTATIAYTGNCTNAGSCTATATYAGDANHSGSAATGSITINKAPTTTSVTFGPGPFVYTGAAFTATASVSPAAAGTASILYSGNCINAGNTCQATATFAGNTNFLPSSASTSIVIKLPVASSAEQCKRGGWQFATDDLGNLFKNQGDCVSYVATNGKNKGNGGN